ncbi:MAG: class I SAM-dependent methyltransferase [Ignavibacteriae bacterium]|nr:class I SAM-dependent methyltransferase [Ignavibacteriota bacterium]
MLEIGCGTGAVLNEFRKRGALVSGFEPSPAAVARARSLYDLTTVVNSPFQPSRGSRRREDPAVERRYRAPRGLRRIVLEHPRVHDG